MNRSARLVIFGASVAAMCFFERWSQDHRGVSLASTGNLAYSLLRPQGEGLYDDQTRVLYHGNPALKEIALTIDDGPHPKTGAMILDILKAAHVKATFFVVGTKMKQRPDLVKRMLAEQHEVGNHTYSHYRLPTLTTPQIANEIDNCDIIFKRLTGRHFDLLRPPGLECDQRVLDAACERGYETISESVAAKDFLELDPGFIEERVVDRVSNGSIILLHDDRDSTVAALPKIIATLKREGYRFVTIRQMLAHLPKPVILESAANHRHAGNPARDENRNRS